MAGKCWVGVCLTILVLTCLILSLVLSLAPVPAAFAAGKKPSPVSTPPVPVGKKIIALAPVPEVHIEMPDQTDRDFGAGYQARLTTLLMQTGKYIVMDAPKDRADLVQGLSNAPPDYSWAGSVTPSAIVRVKVESLNFRTGSRGERMYYGFDEHFKTPFNDGKGGFPNEFPLRLFTSDANWFGDTFRVKGVAPFDSRSGLDLGDGFGLNILFAFLSVKYARYHSELHLQLQIDKFSGGGPSEIHWVEVGADGFFFDISGAYEGYSAGIVVARKDAMTRALLKALDGSVASIERVISELPLVATIDAVLPDGTVLLGTGPQSPVLPGTLYQSEVSWDDPAIAPVVVEVQKSASSGSVTRLIQGEVSQAKAGMLMRQVTSIPQALVSRGMEKSAMLTVHSESVQLPAEVLSSVNLGNWVPIVTRLQAFLRSLAETVFLPYRIARYFLYDQPYKKWPDGGQDRNLDPDSVTETWGQQIGLTETFLSFSGTFHDHPIVAVLDSGIDYNHPVLHRFLWLNPTPWSSFGVGGNRGSSAQDRYGWDFISGDSRPFDDGYHGTQVASLVTAVAQAQLMPLKVFNAYGITTSAAIYGAFVYAVDHGAQIILCAWASPIRSLAMELGIQYAKEHGVVVVAAAGDGGQNLARYAYYPAAFSSQYDNVLTVAGVDANGNLFHSGARASNFHPEWVKIAAPGSNIWVAQPREAKAMESSSGLAAAITAGVLAQSWLRDRLDLSRVNATPETAAALIRRLLDESDSGGAKPGLVGFVENGRMLQIRR